MKLIYPVLIVTLLFAACNHNEQSVIVNNNHELVHGVESELQAFYDLNRLPQYSDSTWCAQVSSYDTTGNNDDGFSGKYSFLSKNADSSLIIFDRQGSGVINRIWTPTPTNDTLDFYIDDDRHPAFSIRYLDLFSGKKFPFAAPLCGNQLGGYYCYVPIPFAKSCRIICRGKKMQFHQIQYRMYKSGSRVKSFTGKLDPEEIQAFEKVTALWNKNKRTAQDYYSMKLSEHSEKFKIQPGEKARVFGYYRGGRILGIEIEPASAFEELEKNTDIKITWDGETNPAVNCPVADFFGYAFGKTSMQSLLLGSRDNKNYCYFPMPFDKEARIELVYRKAELTVQSPLHVSVRVWYSSDKRLQQEEGRFYTHWNKNIRSRKGHPHIFLDVKGKGHYVGTILQAQGMKPGMTYFFEGDDSASMDGTFRIHGTGSEDYFNGGWYAMMDRWDGKMSLPLHGALDYSLPYCRTGGYRLYLSDKLSFEKQFYMSIEHGPVGNNIPVDYTSLALYYSDMPVKELTEPAPPLTRVFVPDTLILFPQLMNFNLSGSIDVKTTWKYGTGGESYLFTPEGDSWLRISMADLPQGKYNVFLDVMKESNGCDISIWQRQTQISDWISTYGAAEERKGKLFACEVDLNVVKSTLTFRFRTDNQKNSFLLNRIILVKKTE